MKQILSKCAIGVVCALLLLSAWGCSQESIIPPDIPMDEPPPSLPETSKVMSFRFGAVHYTYADVYAQPDVHSERLTQCVYGDVVRIEEENTWWYAVKIGPYPELAGWIHKAAITMLPSASPYMKERSLTTIVIRQNVSHIFVWPDTTIDIVMGTELPFLGESGQWYLVRLPTNDIGKIAREAAYPETAYPSVAVEPLIHSKQKPAPAPIAASQQRRNIVNTARGFLGIVYIWGGTTPRGFDCSGLSYLVYKLNGIELPRVSWLQFQTGVGTTISRSHLRKGDLVFFQTYRKGPSHVGIYIGNNQFIHASPTYGVTVNGLDEPYFRSRYVGAKTILPTSS